MIELLINYWYIFLIVIIATFFLTLLVQKRIIDAVKNFFIFSKVPLLKKYWLFVIPFSFLSISAYIFMIKSFPHENLNNNISLLNQATTLIFAIFAGYFAFQQVVENRLERLKEQGHNYFKQNSYKRAIQYYEQALAINSKDFSVLAELLELYLVIQDDKRFNERIAILEKIVMEDYERTTVYYLKIAKLLFKQELGTAKKELKEYISLVKKKPSALVHFSWDFSDIRKSEVYQKLDGETKTIFENFINYLNKSLDESNKELFEESNFTLKEEIKDQK